MSLSELPSKIDPVIFHLGPFALQWYSLMYVAAITTAYFLTRRALRRNPAAFPPEAFEDVLPWLVFGAVAGARLGYVLFYDPAYYLSRPWEIVLPFQWEGGFVFTGIRGLSYHGGLAGVILAGVLFCRRRALDPRRLGDALAAPVAFGYTWGRLGNFLNGELYGRATSVPWGMYFPSDPTGLLRHPSQLYEAVFEGVFLGMLLSWFARRPAPAGSLSLLYAAGYGTARFVIEYFREPDVHLGLLGGVFSMGQWLCLAMVAGSIGFFIALNSKS